MTDSGHSEEPFSHIVWDRHAERLLTAMAFAILAMGTISYRLLEDWSWVDAFYFSAVTATTVGFGDLAPTTEASKLFTVFYIFSSIAVIAAFVDRRIKRRAIRVARRRRT